MKSIVFDTGPIITLAMNNLLWLLEPLKKMSSSEFLITDLVKQELVDNPLTRTKRFKFEALQVLHYIENNTLSVTPGDSIRLKTEELALIANSCFSAFGRDMKIVHDAEMSSIAIYLQRKSDAFVVDEKTTRLLIENPLKLHNILKHSLHASITINKSNIRKFQDMTKGVRMIRSAELAIIAYEKGLLDQYLPKMPDGRKELLESVLWGVKLGGSAITKSEIEQVVRMEIK